MGGSESTPAAEIVVYGKEVTWIQAPEPHVLPVCGICRLRKPGHNRGGNPPRDLAVPCGWRQVRHICGPCYEACWRWARCTEKDLVQALGRDPQSCEAAFQVINRLRRVFNSRVHRKRIAKDFSHPRRRSKLRPLLRHTVLMQELQK